MRNLLVAFLATLCGTLGSLLWGRVMTDAPDGTVRFMAFVFWAGLGAMAGFSDPIYGYLVRHWKIGIGAAALWVLLGVLFAASKLFRSARLTMWFVEGKSPYQESD